MLDTQISLAKLQGAEAAVEEIRDQLQTADDTHRPGLRVALNVLDELRVNLSNYHSGMCRRAADERARDAAAAAVRDIRG